MRPGSSLLLLAITPAVGASFGAVGPCVQIVGTAYRQVDPTHPLKAIVTDEGSRNG